MTEPGGSHGVVVDIDVRETWPPDVAELVESWHDQVVARDDFAMDLRLLEAEPELLAMLSGQRVRAYHCTRLFPYEMEQVRREGLRPFTRALFDEKLDRALRLGALTDTEHAGLRSGHLGVAEPRRAKGRQGVVSLSLGVAVLDCLSGVERLLSRWGGEGIHFSAVGDQEPALQALGQPVVMVCAIEVGAASPTRVFPALPVALLRVRRGLVAKADFFVGRTVTPDEIELVAGPGHEIYDAHPELPRT